MTRAETEKLIREMFPDLFDERAKQQEEKIKNLPPSSEYAEEALNWMKEKGYMNGDGKGRMMARSALTREQYAIVEYNEAKADGRA